MVSDDPVEKTLQWDQFLPLMKFDLYPTKAAVIPFLILLFGTPDVKVPWFPRGHRQRRLYRAGLVRLM
jgi:hypothetical protein